MSLKVRELNASWLKTSHYLSSTPFHFMHCSMTLFFVVVPQRERWQFYIIFKVLKICLTISFGLLCNWKFIQSALYRRLWQTKKSQINTKEPPPKRNHVWFNRDYYMTYIFFSLHLTHPSCVNTELSLISFWSCLFSCTSWASSLLRDVSNFLMF